MIILSANPLMIPLSKNKYKNIATEKKANVVKEITTANDVDDDIIGLSVVVSTADGGEVSMVLFNSPNTRRGKARRKRGMKRGDIIIKVC